MNSFDDDDFTNCSVIAALIVAACVVALILSGAW